MATTIFPIAKHYSPVFSNGSIVAMILTAVRSATNAGLSVWRKNVQAKGNSIVALA
jgi:hypothetical protein